MIRRLVRFAVGASCLLSLIASLAAAVLWVRSYSRSTYWVLSFNRPEPGAVVNDSHAFYAGRGGLFYQRETARILDPQRWPQYARPREFLSMPTSEPQYPHSRPLTPSPLNRFGVEWSNDRWATETWQVRHF